MNWVFMNSLQKRTEEDRVATAQVMIGENAGIWHVFWTEPAAEGGMEETCWFEGASWNEMLASFRGNLLEKMADGYAPLLDNVTGDIQSISGKSEWVQKLYYYSNVHKNETVYEALREWRRKQAGIESKAPYLIATNRLLDMISAFLPRTEDELLQLPGLGPNKVKRYGKDLLAIASAAERHTGFPLDWVEGRIDYAQYKLWLHRQHMAFQEKDRERKERRSSLLAAVSQGAALSSIGETLSISRRETLQLLEELGKEGIDIEPVIAEETKELPVEQQEKVISCFALMGDKYVKPVLEQLNKEGLWMDIQADRAYEWLRLLRIRYRQTQGKNMVKAG